MTFRKQRGIPEDSVLELGSLEESFHSSTKDFGWFVEGMRKPEVSELTSTGLWCLPA